jgi:hypothetical protein
VGGSPYRCSAFGEGREWDELIDGDNSNCWWEAAICVSKMGEKKKEMKGEALTKWGREFF